MEAPVPASSVYHAIFLEELTTLELIEKIASLYSISPQHIHRVYRQGPTGIHVVVSNEVSLLPALPGERRSSGPCILCGLGVTLAQRLPTGFTGMPQAAVAAGMLGGREL